MRSNPSVHKARRLDALLELFAQRPELEYLHGRTDLKARIEKLAQGLAGGFRRGAAFHLDPHEQALERSTVRVFEHGLEVDNGVEAEYDILEFGMVNVDAANLEESGRTIGMADH